jgi:hypothetical protein
MWIARLRFVAPLSRRGRRRLRAGRALRRQMARWLLLPSRVEPLTLVFTLTLTPPSSPSAPLAMPSPSLAGTAPAPTAAVSVSRGGGWACDASSEAGEGRGGEERGGEGRRGEERRGEERR